MFNDKQTQALTYTLDNSRIKSRTKGNVSLSYLEGHDIIETSNKIFGFGNWNYSISSLEQVSQETNEKQNVVVGYKAIVSVTVYDQHHAKQVSREDVGFGTGISKSLADSHEGAAKEAVTDAIKRCFRSFGNQFGNSLYDKSRAHHNQQPAQLEQPQQRHDQPSTHQVQNNTPADYASLYKIGLSVVSQGHNLIIVGDDIFAKKDSIKAFGFRWDGASKYWYKPIEQQVA